MAETLSLALEVGEGSVTACSGHRRTFVGLVPRQRIFPSAVLAPLGAEVPTAGEPVEGVEVGIDVEDHVPSFAPVATGRPAEGDIFLAPESDAAVAAVPGFDLDDGLVNEHRSALFFPDLGCAEDTGRVLGLPCPLRPSGQIIA